MKNTFEIRHAKLNDLKDIMPIYAQARAYMKDHGNPNQWGPTNWPPEALIRKDIEANKSYLCLYEGEIAAVFFFDYGKDVEPTYSQIDDGHWNDASPYGVIHRIAVKKHHIGAASTCIQYAYEKIHHLRMDTHSDNIPMQHLLTKLGFVYCGIIYVHEDKAPRLAYEKTEEKQ